MKRPLTWLLSLALLLSLPLNTALGGALGVWLPYWEAEDALTELEALQGNVDAAIAFACIFDAQDRPLMLPETEALFAAITQACTGTDSVAYLSIVNDVETSPGQYDNKSKPLLERLLADEAAISRHLEDLVRLIDRYDLRGLELDYENLKGDTALWLQYATLISRLWDVCARDAIRLRVVLPWDAPKYAALPAGPEYTVMCYNLFGYHSGPGPKADIPFLTETCALYQNQPYTTRMAFANGGFAWRDSGISALTQTEAEALLQGAAVTPTRDAASQALTATFTVDGETTTVWYADTATLAAWRAVCESSGFLSSDLFRLGGNELSGLLAFAEHP